MQWPITLEHDRAWHERTGNEGPLSHEFTGYADEPASPLATALARSVVTPSPIKREEDPLEVEVLRPRARANGGSRGGLRGGPLEFQRLGLPVALELHIGRHRERDLSPRTTIR